MEMVDRIMQWSNVNSGSLNVAGLERMSSLLTQAFLSLGCDSTTVSLPLMEIVDNAGLPQTVEVGPLLRFWKRPEAPIQVLLVGHMDTVFEPEHPFQQAMRHSDSILVGPGVADMKGGLCVMLEALKAFEASSVSKQLGWEVLINPDEEMGSIGSGAYLAERAKAHQVGLLFEPAMDESGTLAGERKGSGRFTVVVRGRAAHAGRDFQEGRNAITALANIIQQLELLNGQRAGVTLNIGQIQGGGAVNVVPALAIARLDIRISEVSDAMWVQEHLKLIINAANEREGFQVELKGQFNRKPKPMVGKTKELYEWAAGIGKNIGQTLTWKPSGGCCDGNNLYEAGLPNIDSLGVCGGKIHSSEEYLKIDSLASRVQLTTAILLGLNEGLPFK